MHSGASCAGPLQRSPHRSPSAPTFVASVARRSRPLFGAVQNATKRAVRDRVDALHGRLEITASPGRGAMVAGSVPVA